MPAPTGSRPDVVGGAFRNTAAPDGITTAGAAKFHFRNLPFCDLDAIAPGPALVIAPHPDDESLGCGGLIAASCARGQPPVVVILTDGSGSHPGSRTHPASVLRDVREAEAKAAIAALGLPEQRLHFLRLPDGHAPCTGQACDQVAQDVAAIGAAAGVRTVLTTWVEDPHGDHVAAAHIGRRVAALTRCRLVAYPIWGWMLPDDLVLSHPVGPGARFAMEDWLPHKRRAVAAHRSQMTDLIADDPSGFKLAPDFLAHFDQPQETFLFLDDPT